MMRHVIGHVTLESGQRPLLHVPPFEHGDALIARKTSEAKTKQNKEREKKKRDPKM
jgi:hypothetical protein